RPRRGRRLGRASEVLGMGVVGRLISWLGPVSRSDGWPPWELSSRPRAGFFWGLASYEVRQRLVARVAMRWVHQRPQTFREMPAVRQRRPGRLPRRQARGRRPRAAAIRRPRAGRTASIFAVARGPASWAATSWRWAWEERMVAATRSTRALRPAPAVMLTS